MQNHIKTPDEGALDPQLKKIIAGIAILLILLAGFLYWQKSQTPANPTAPAQQNESIDSTTPNDISSTVETEPDEEPIDTSDWKTYTSSAAGITFKYPEKVFHSDANTGTECPLVIYEDTVKKSIGIAFKCKTPTQADWQKAMPANSSAFDGWEIKYANAKNDQDINTFIEQRINQEIDQVGEKPMKCKLETKTPYALQTDVFEIGVNSYKNEKGENVGLDETICGLNFGYSFLYAPQNQKVLFVTIGQEPRYYGKNEQGEQIIYDGEIMDSLRFIK